MDVQIFKRNLGPSQFVIINEKKPIVIKMDSDIPEPLASFMNVSSKVRSAGESDPGITECAASITPLSIRYAAPG